MLRRLFCLLLCLGLLGGLCAECALADREDWEPIDGWETVPVSGLRVEQRSFWTGEGPLAECVVRLAPEPELRVVSVGGAAVCQSLGMAAAGARLEESGLHPLAAVNGGFFNLLSLATVGISVQNGTLRSWAAEDAWMQAIGFCRDGSALIGKPMESLTLAVGELELQAAALNRPRGEGLCLYTPDCMTNGRSAASGDGWNLLCKLEGTVPVSGSRELEVLSLSRDEGAVEVPEGCLLCSVAGEEAPEPLRSLRPSDRLTLRAGCAEGWERAESAVGLLYPLVEDGNALPQKLTGADPRSAVGLTAEGEIVLYTVDGRQEEHSRGLGLDAVARRMLELGCVTAGALDGGTSTALGVCLPGDAALSVRNSPSGGGRKVVNWLMAVTERRPTGTAARLSLEPLRVNAVAGAEIPLTVSAVDENGYPAPVPEELSFSVPDGLGRVENGILICAGTGSGSLRVSAPGLEAAEIPLRVTETPDELALYGEVYGRKTDSLRLNWGQEVDLTVRAKSNHVLLHGGDTCYSWSLEESAGTVDETGHLIPAPVTGKGLLTVSAGARSLSIPISVWSGVPFADVSALDPRFPAVRYCYEHKLFNGVDERTFAPETVMNRAMLVTVLWRLRGSPESGEKPAFADVRQGDWFADAVAWAAETGLVTGYSERAFGPYDDLTKEQILTVLHRAAGLPASAGDLKSWSDGDAAGAWAEAALLWALEQGILQPEGDALTPQEPMDRAAVAEALMRYLEK